MAITNKEDRGLHAMLTDQIGAKGDIVLCEQKVRYSRGFFQTLGFFVVMTAVSVALTALRVNDVYHTHAALLVLAWLVSLIGAAAVLFQRDYETSFNEAYDTNYISRRTKQSAGANEPRISVVWAPNDITYKVWVKEYKRANNYDYDKDWLDQSYKYSSVCHADIRTLLNYAGMDKEKLTVTIASHSGAVGPSKIESFLRDYSDKSEAMKEIDDRGLHDKDRDGQVAAHRANARNRA